MEKRAYAIRALIPVLFSFVLAACGGGGGSGGGSESPTTGGGTQSGTSDGTTTPNTPSPTPAAGQPPAATPARSFTASLVRAPVDGEEVSGVVRLEVQGTALGNVELLPADVYTPRLGTFTISGDRTSAYLDFDTTTVPNGILRVRISVFSAAAGTPDASELTVMSSRTWTFRNTPPPFGSASGRAARCQEMDYRYTDPGATEPVVCVRFQVASPPIPPEQCTTSFATPYLSPEDGREVFRTGELMPKLYCEPGAYEGRVNPGCECVPR